MEAIITNAMKKQIMVEGSYNNNCYEKALMVDGSYNTKCYEKANNGRWKL